MGLGNLENNQRIAECLDEIVAWAVDSILSRANV